MIAFIVTDVACCNVDRSGYLTVRELQSMVIGPGSGRFSLETAKALLKALFSILSRLFSLSPLRE